ncbi:MAG: peptidase C13 [Caulobacteraceae bacterium]|nr:peptidase C13 [Caulobacteraceae bacterium]
MRTIALLAAIVALGGVSKPAAAASADAFADWAVIVVSGDDHAAHEDRPTQAFDNARRDVATAFERKGFLASNLAEVSVHEAADEADPSHPPELDLMQRRLAAKARQAQAGCLVYVTSHGSPDGVLLGDRLATPSTLRTLVTRACPGRPTAVILSACYSGAFVPALAQALGPDGFVFTAARRDRSSFGCSENDRYPFFDGCVIQNLPPATSFLDLADRVRKCVKLREDEEGMRPRSMPQVYAGSAFQADRLRFPSPPPGSE